MDLESFEELNVLAYCTLVGLLLDVVLWCLAPYVDDSRRYGIFRLLVAAVTRRACRAWLVWTGTLPATD